MKTKLYAGLLGTLALSGCVVTDDIIASGPATGVSGATVASRYNATIATDNKTLAQADAASIAANGGFAVEGYRLSTLGMSAAFKTQIIGDDIILTVNGSTFVFKDAKTIDNLAGMTSTNGVLKFVAGPKGTYSEVGGGSKTFNGVTEKAIVGVRGLQTQTANLPTSKATYDGTYLAMEFDNGTVTSRDGIFTADVDFGVAKSIKGTFTKDGVKLGTLTAKITGNSFTGTTALKLVKDGPAGLVASSGNFFGPNGEEIAGVANGDVGSKKAAVGFLGTKK